jgi:hypothetical protein
LLLLQLPGVVLLPSVVVRPAQTDSEPVIGPGNGLTVTTAVRLQPPVNEYDIVVVPAAMPPTTPVELTVATDGLLLAHVPPVEIVAKVVNVPEQSPKVPVIASGTAFTVTSAVVMHPVAAV